MKSERHPFSVNTTIYKDTQQYFIRIFFNSGTLCLPLHTSKNNIARQKLIALYNIYNSNNVGHMEMVFDNPHKLLALCPIDKMRRRIQNHCAQLGMRGFNE